MSEYIITDTQLAVLVAKCDKIVNEDSTPFYDPKEIAEIIDEPITLKKIVRCRDCMYRNPDPSEAIWEENGKVYRGFPKKSAYLCNLINRCVDISGFCKWGQRKQDDE